MNTQKGRILIRLTEDRMGNITLRAVNKRVRKELAKMNVYNGEDSVFWQEVNGVKDSQYPIDLLPRSAFYGRGKEKCFNDGAKFLMDRWTFEQMVGGH